MISEKLGVKEIHVSLEAKEAKVSYNAKDITADEIANFIEDMGFDAFVKEVDGHLENISKDKSTDYENKKEEVLIELNGGGDVKPEKEFAKCFLHIQVCVYKLSLHY